MENILEQQLLAATQIIEQKLDSEIQQLDNMKESDYEELRARRLEALKNAEKQKQEWRAAGHGTYEEIGDEAEFFATCKKSKNVICHFYRDSTFACKVVDKHLALLAPKHLETRFVKINAERSKFLVDRLRIKMLPTICIAREGKTVDYVVGLDELGGREDFPTEMLEWRLGRAGVIEYSGDLLTPPSVGGARNNLSSLAAGKSGKKKAIRDDDDDSSDDD